MTGMNMNLNSFTSSLADALGRYEGLDVSSSSNNNSNNMNLISDCSGNDSRLAGFPVRNPKSQKHLEQPPFGNSYSSELQAANCNTNISRTALDMIDQRDVELLQDASRRMSLAAVMELDSYSVAGSTTGASVNVDVGPQQPSTRIDSLSYSPHSMISQGGGNMQPSHGVGFPSSLSSNGVSFDGSTSTSSTSRHFQRQDGDVDANVNVISHHSMTLESNPRNSMYPQALDAADRRISTSSSTWSGKENLAPSTSGMNMTTLLDESSTSDLIHPASSNMNMNQQPHRRHDMVMSSVMNLPTSTDLGDPSNPPLALEFAVKYQNMLSNLIDAMERSERTRTEVNKLRPEFHAVCKAINGKGRGHGQGRRRSSIPPYPRKKIQAERRGSPPLKKRLSSAGSGSGRSPQQVRVRM